MRHQIKNCGDTAQIQITTVTAVFVSRGFCEHCIAYHPMLLATTSLPWAVWVLHLVKTMSDGAKIALRMARMCGTILIAFDGIYRSQHNCCDGLSKFFTGLDAIPTTASSVTSAQHIFALILYITFQKIFLKCSSA